MIRRAWDWLNRTARLVAPEGSLRWHFLTFAGHATVAAICVGLVAPLLLVDVDLRVYAACAAGGFYAIEEFRQRFIYRPPTSAPWWDSLGDVLAPWLIGLWLAT